MRWGPVATPLLMAALPLLLLIAAAPAQAAINGLRPFSFTDTFSDGLEDGQPMTYVSGRVDVDLVGVAGNFGFFNATDAALLGSGRVCWGTLPTQCATGAALRIEVEQGRSFGLGLPVLASGTFHADHALGIHVDFASRENLNDLDLERSLMAPVVDGRMAFSDLLAIADTLRMDDNNSGAVVGLEATSVVRVESNGNVLHVLHGKDERILFSGQWQAPEFGAELVVLPFEAGSTAAWRSAPRAAAEEGLEFTRLQDMTRKLDEANAQDRGSSVAEPDPGMRKFHSVLADVFDGAILHTAAKGSTQEEVRQEFRFVRFSRFDVQATASGIEGQGQAPLEVQRGHVSGSQPLHGVGFVSFPWWSWLLWALAAALFATARLMPRRNRQGSPHRQRALHPDDQAASGMARPSRHPRKGRGKAKEPKEPDPLRWLAVVASIVATATVFLLWDLETRAVWGVSLLSGTARGQALAMVAALQLIPFGLAMAATAAPLGIIFSNGLRVAGLNAYRRLGGAAATLLGFVLAAFLLRSYLDVIAGQVIDRIG